MTHLVRQYPKRESDKLSGTFDYNHRLVIVWFRIRERECQVGDASRLSSLG